MDPSSRKDYFETQSLKISQREFDRFKDFLQSSCGIVLSDSKQYLVSSRLGKLLKIKELGTLDELISAVVQDNSNQLKQVVIEAMTTHETMWFRDDHPFQFLQDKFFPSLMENGKQKEIRIWSAACSSGQEPYSISMAFQESLERNRLLSSGSECKIIATDISKSVLAMARSGVYDQLSINRGISQERIRRHFSKLEKNLYSVNDSIKSRVDFGVFNLTENFPYVSTFDCIFCRNVLIYFSPELKKKILLQFHKALKTGGILVLGASETLNDVRNHYELIRYPKGMVYKKI